MKFGIFIFVIFLFLLLNIVIYKRINNTFKQSKLKTWILRIVFFILATSFILSALFGDYLPFQVSYILSTIGTSWLMLFIYVVIVFLLQSLISFLSKKKVIPENIAQTFGVENKYATWFYIALVLAIGCYGYINYQMKEVVYLPIEMGKSLKDKRLKIVALSDLHLGYTIHADELATWVDFVNEQKPDVVLIAGDLIDSSLKAVNKKEISNEFRRIKAPLGVYASLGNHEYLSSKGDLAKLQGYFDDWNIHLLVDDVCLVDSTFYIVGRDDKTNKNRKSLAELIEPLDKTKSIFLLDHQPFHLEEAEEQKVDFQLSGHTHEGQIWPFKLITKAIYESDHGYLKKSDTHVYVSSGVGIWGGKFRIGTKSEFVIIDINNK